MRQCPQICFYVAAFSRRMNVMALTLCALISLIHLPVRMGGLGLAQHQGVADGIYTAARSNAQDIVQAICPGLHDMVEAEEGPTAKEVRQSHNINNRNNLKSKLSLHQTQAVLENASYLGRKWLRVLPTRKNYLLADPQYTEALRTRLLLPVLGEASTCMQCASPCDLGHEDDCAAAQRHTIQRHNKLCITMHRWISTVPSTNASLEPLLPTSGPKELGSCRRGDIAITIGNNRRF